jgi:hypothetical protein
MKPKIQTFKTVITFIFASDYENRLDLRFSLPPESTDETATINLNDSACNMCRCFAGQEQDQAGEI